MRDIIDFLMASTVYILFLMLVACAAITEGSEDMDHVGDIQDYCDPDPYFEPQCGADEIIVVKHARYGRMRQSRCISNKGAIGCSADVKDLLQEQCSGRRSCQLVVARAQPKNNPPCEMDMNGYLEVAFECVEVIQAPEKACKTGRLMEIREPRGYLSSYDMAGTGCASENNPLRIIAQPGQILRFSLLYFGPLIKSRSSVCHVLALIKDNNKEDTESVCAGESRTSLVYTSSSNAAAVTFMSASERNDHQNHFLIEFEAIGCADPPSPVNGWMKRSGDKVSMGCHHDASATVNEWSQHCEGRAWVGVTHNCTIGGSASSQTKRMWTELLESKGFYILVAIAIVVCASLCILMLALIYVKRHWKRGRQPAGREVQEARWDGKSVRRSMVSDMKSDECYYSPDSDYYGTQRTWPRGCPTRKPSSTAIKAIALPPYATVCRKGRLGEDEHEYEIPQVMKIQRDENKDGTAKKSRKYYELDPNYVDDGATQDT